MNPKVTYEELEDRIKKLEQKVLLCNQVDLNFKYLFNSIEYCIFIYDLKGIIIETNNSVTMQLGYSSEELIGQDIRIVFSDNSILDKSMQIVEMTSEFEDYHYNSIHSKFGEAYRAKTKIFDGYWSGNKVFFCNSIIKSRLTENQRKNEAIPGAAKETLALIDKSGLIKVINKIGAERLGSFPEKMVGKNIFSFFPPEYTAERKKYLNRVIENKESIQYEDKREKDSFLIKLLPVKDEFDNIETVIVIADNITNQKAIEEKYIKNNLILEEMFKERTRELEDINTTLTVLLNKREEDKAAIEEKIFSNYKHMILPIIDKIRDNQSNGEFKNLLIILETGLKEIVSPFSKKLSDPLINLTPTEITIAGMIKIGKSNKEIADILNNSVHTICRHRENIRKKTGLKNKKANLRSYLSSL